MNLLQPQDFDRSAALRPLPRAWGMLHLAALPGSPDYAGSLEAVEDRALAEASALTAAGFRGLVVENFGDRPFLAGTVPSVTLTAMTRIAARLRAAYPDVHMVINCLRNDPIGGLSVAVAADADAIRVNVHCGAMVTDQGIIEGRAGDTLRRRREWGAERVRIFADVAVKHAVPLASRPLSVEAADLRDRGCADALLVTGQATGVRADPAQIEQIREGAPQAPVIVASGVDELNAVHWATLVDAAIIGSSLMRGGCAGAGVDPDRARRVLEAWHGARQKSPKESRQP